MTKVKASELELALRELFEATTRPTVERITDTGMYHAGLTVIISGRHSHGGKLHKLEVKTKTISSLQADIEAKAAAKKAGIVRDVVILDRVMREAHYTKRSD